MAEKSFEASGRDAATIKQSFEENKELVTDEGKLTEKMILQDVRTVRDNFLSDKSRRDQLLFNMAFTKFSKQLEKKYGRAYLEDCSLWHLMAGSKPSHPCTMLDFPKPEDSVIKFLKDYINEHPAPSNPAIIK